VKTNDLIDLLAQDALPGRPFERMLALAVACGVLVTGLVFFAAIGFRPDIAVAVGSARFLFKFVVTVTLAVGATGAVLKAGRPGVDVAGWRWVLAAVPALLACAVGLELLAVPESAWLGRLVGRNAWTCLTLIPALAIAPLVCLLIALRHGAPTRPRLAGALAGLAASGIAATFYASNCIDDSPLFVATWYVVASTLVACAGCLAGHRVLRW
jgi:hypothetical protein